MPNESRRRLLQLGAVLLAGSLAPLAAANAQESLGTVSISVVPSTSAVVLYVAQSQGLFEAEGLDVQITEFSSGAESERAMAAGAVDMGSGGAGTTLIMANQGIEAKNVVLFQNRSIFTLVASNALEGEPGDLNALRGKNVGISSPGSLTDLFLRIVLSDAGIDPDRDLTIVATGGLASHLPALEAGRVDAQMTWEPATVMITKGEEAGWVLFDLRTDQTSPSLQNLLGSSLQATADWLANDQNLEKAKAAARAVTRARQAIVDDPEIMIDSLRGIFPDLDQELLAEIARIEAPSYAGVITPEAIEHMSNVYLSAGLIATAVTYDQIVDSRIAAEWE